MSGSPTDFYPVLRESMAPGGRYQKWVGKWSARGRGKEQGQCPPGSLGLLTQYPPTLLSGPSPFQTLPGCPLPH